MSANSISSIGEIKLSGICLAAPDALAKADDIALSMHKQTKVLKEALSSLNDLTAEKTNINKIRQHIGMVFQHFNLFPHLTVLENILNVTINENYKGKVSSGEIGLPMEESKLVLPCGIYGRWEK